jgi:hypothetical protein
MLGSVSRLSSDWLRNRKKRDVFKHRLDVGSRCLQRLLLDEFERGMDVFKTRYEYEDCAHCYSVLAKCQAAFHAIRKNFALTWCARELTSPHEIKSS